MRYNSVEIPTKMGTFPQYQYHVKGEKKTPEEMEQILAERRANWKGFESKYKSGLLKLYAQHAVSSMKGAYME